VFYIVAIQPQGCNITINVAYVLCTSYNSQSVNQNLYSAKILKVIKVRSALMSNQLKTVLNRCVFSSKMWLLKRCVFILKHFCEISSRSDLKRRSL